MEDGSAKPSSATVVSSIKRAPISLLLSIPTELHHQILAFLPYPDLLALKHTHPHFYCIASTTVHHRLNWLIERSMQGLSIPQRNCILKTDADFCSTEVRVFMERRRWHLDCSGKPKRCLVLEGQDCPPTKSRARRGGLQRYPAKWFTNSHRLHDNLQTWRVICIFLVFVTIFELLAGFLGCNEALAAT